MAEPYEIRMGEPARKIVIDVEGTVYRFRRPKKRWLMRAAAGFSEDATVQDQAASYDRIEQTILKCMSKDDAEHLQQRLDDPDDVVDVEHMLEILKKLMGDAAGTPPTLPTDSPASPVIATPPSSDGPSLMASGSTR